MEQWTKDELNAAIAETGKTAAEVNTNIHIILCQAIGHALVSSGDVTAFDRVLDEFKGQDRKAIAAWVVEFAPVKFVDGSAKLNKGKYKDMQPDGANPFDLDAYIEGVMWTEYLPTKRQILATFDLEARVVSLLDQLDKKHEEGKPVVNDELASYLRTALLGFHEMKAAQKIAPANAEEVEAAA